MKDKKLQVFVSSTYTDLKEERQSAVEAILSSGNIPAGMELFSAGDESQMTVIERWIDESDVYLLILGGRYGSIEKKTGKSYTHLEYEYALSLNKPMFAIVINEAALEKKVKDRGTSAIETENAKELTAFKKLVLLNLVKFYDDTKDIKIAIHETLSDFAYRKGLIGWIRGDNNVNAAKLAEEIARLTSENSELRELLETYKLTTEKKYCDIYTYNELKTILETKMARNNFSLLDYIIKNGDKLVSSGVQVYSFDSLPELYLYKLIKNETITRDKHLLYFASFTEDGHDFYLKTISKMGIATTNE